MARILQTAVSDEINALAFDEENREERRRESVEYQREIMGYYDEDYDPQDHEDYRFGYEGPEDFGWDGGMEP